ncbi:MAG: hypothetical protein F9K29_07845 [Hyphomicrobiaceae bacterium]|nr:MAG: hypothetical protein F9K29_07845 [Hyphomicrobiaceae bacterium]
MPDESSPGAPHAQFPQSQTATSNLTQELAQLLAATIAHNQATRGIPGGVPTGAELASLASLMTAASSQRTLAPAFQDGLSALAYSQPRPGPQHGPLDHDPHHDDEPMPIPSTWRQPPAGDDDKWYRQQMGAAFMGLAAGLVIVVPTVLWLSGWVGGAQKAKSTPTPPVQTAAVTSDAVRSPEIRTVKVQPRPIERADTAAQFVTGSTESRLGVEIARPAEPPKVTVATTRPVEPQQPRIEEFLAQANRRIENGDIMGAREILAGADPNTQGMATFALAETYDPNMLAAWGTRGVAADVARARALYTKALDLGVSKAQTRLDGLR